MTTDRVKICKITIGSHLYGTNRPESDMDISGVFLHSEDDLLGLQNPPAEISESVKITEGPRNGLGDLDCKFYSLQRFINLAAQGQPGQLELLFAPESAYLPGIDFHGRSVWHQVLENKHLFLSKKSIWPFVGFALAQANKTCLKGDNLKQLREVIALLSGLTAAEQQQPLRDWMVGSTRGENWYRFGYSRGSEQVQTGWLFELRENDRHFSCLWIAGRQYDPGAKTKTVLKNLEGLEAKYGTRSKAAAEQGLDYKSLMHAYRLLGQAEEFMATGTITLPRCPVEVAHLLRIRNGQISEDFDWLDDINGRIDRIRTELEPKSPLPAEPDYSRLNKLYKAIMRRHLG